MSSLQPDDKTSWRWKNTITIHLRVTQRQRFPTATLSCGFEAVQKVFGEHLFLQSLRTGLWPWTPESRAQNHTNFTKTWTVPRGVHFSGVMKIHSFA